MVDAKAEIYRLAEVLTGPGRRRQWSEEAKAQIVSDALQQVLA
jgi:transposase